MEIGSNKSLFTLIAVVIFGVFLSLSYWMFQDELTNVLASVFDKTSEMSSIKLENNGLIPTDLNYFTYVVNGDNTIKITNYTGNLDGITNVTIPAYIDGKPVTTIGSIAFQGKGLTSVILPYTLLRIDDGIYPESGRIGAFSDNNLTEITIPDSVTYVGFWAFAKNKIITLNLGDNLAQTGSWAFFRNKIRVINLPNSMRILGDGTFEENYVDVVNLNEGLTTIKTSVFYNCFGKITSIKIPSTVTYLDQHTFAYTESIKEFQLPKSLLGSFDTTKVAISHTYDPLTGKIIGYNYFDSKYFSFY